MKRIKVLALTLALGVAGMMYAASSHAQSTTQDNTDDCCAGQSCCTGGSCCTTHKK